jgi:GT2 family glycosyltransferase
MKIEKIQNTRKSAQEKIKDALAKAQTKPTYIVKDKLAKKPQHVAIPQSRQSYVSAQRNPPQRPSTFEPTITQQEQLPLPKERHYKMPEWFESKGPIDISIIVPLYKSHEVIQEQIESWDLVDDGLKKEIIYVNDLCPFNSYKSVINSWEVRRNELKQPVGKIILNTSNGGYAAACNVGASYATGKYLIFLNADCVVTPNWIKPLYDLAESDKTIGIIGNMQFKKSGYIDSAGSQWSWQDKTFRHIARNIYNGIRISKPLKPNKLPKNLSLPLQREMVTGCCFIIRADLFETTKFDTSFRIGYWEDSDLNMKVQELGYKVYFEPRSIIYHKGGHSQASGHRYMSDNRNLFYKRWVNNGRFENFINTPRPTGKLVKDIRKSVKGDVIGCVIACNEEEFLEASVDSIAPLVNRWIIVIGGNSYAYKAGMCDSKGYPKDNTLSIAKKLVAKYGGEVIEPPGRLWADKVEMRNAYADKLHIGDWMFMLDGDEVYNENQLWRVTELMQKYEVLTLQFHLIWNKMNVIGTDTWDSFPQERIVKWRPTFKYRGTNHLKVTCEGNRLASDVLSHYQGTERLFYHYSWIRPIEKIRQKIEYYHHQSGSLMTTNNYVDNVFLKWRTDPESVIGKTHPMGGGSFAKFKGLHPRNVQELTDQGKLNF